VAFYLCRSLSHDHVRDPLPPPGGFWSGERGSCWSKRPPSPATGFTLVQYLCLLGGACLEIHLVDGTYELFRHYYALPSARDENGREVAAVRGVLASVLGMVKAGATYLAVATDHVIESFRNRLWPGYKTGEGVEADLLAQFPLLEEALDAAGVVVWPMVEFEADDALAAAAKTAAKDAAVDRVIICTPDKDLAQCVSGSRIVQLNRRTRTILDEPAIMQKFGVSPQSIPDYLALVGDAADGYPGLPGWGAKSSAAVLEKFSHLESIPKDFREWHVNAASASTLADTLCREWDNALLFANFAALDKQWKRRIANLPKPNRTRHTSTMNLNLRR